jgi:hypothetical protein
VGLYFSDDASSSWVNESDLLVLGGGGQLSSVVVPVNGLDNVRVTIDIELGVSLLNIPELDGEIGGGGGENVAGNWVEVDGSDLSLVSGEGLNWGGDGGGGSSFGDLPDLSVTVLSTGSDEALVEGVELDVKDFGGVTTEEWKAGGELSWGICVQDSE